MLAIRVVLWAIGCYLLHIMFDSDAVSMFTKLSEATDMVFVAPLNLKYGTTTEV